MLKMEKTTWQQGWVIYCCQQCRILPNICGLSSCLPRASMTIIHFIIQLTHNIQYADTIKIIKYLKVLQHVSDHRGSIIGEPCTGLG